MKKLRKVAVVLLCAIMVLSTVGCKKTEKTSLPESKVKVDANVPSWKVDTESADLSWYINFDWFAQTWGNDVATKYITEDTHVNITYLSGSDENLNTMLASGELPDIITLDNTNSIVKDAAKFALALDELAEKYDPYFLSNAAKKETVNFYTQKDGHIYGYPNFSTTKQDYEEGGVYANQAFLVRKDIYESLGQPDMSTPKGFLEALSAAQALGAKDGLGMDVIPFGTTPFNEGSEMNAIFNKTLMDFLGVPVLNDNNTLYDRYTDADFITWIKTIAEARRNGYTDSDMLTMGRADKDAKLSNGSYFVYFTSDVNSETDSLTMWDTEHPEQSYIAVDGPASTVGRKIALNATSIEGWTLTFITKNCKNPQKAMELITYLVSEEGDTVMNFGRLGETYEIVDGKPVMNQDLLEYKQSDPAGFEKEIGLTTHLWVQDSVRLSRKMGIDQWAKVLQQPKAWTEDKLVPLFETAQLDLELSKEAARNAEKITQFWGQTVAAMMESQTNEEIDQAIESYINYRNQNGYEELLKQRNEKVISNIEKLK